MAPIIGITTSINAEETVLEMNRTYTDAIMHAGAIPVLLPPTENPDLLAQYVQLIDGLLLSGGGDINPEYFSENQHWSCGDVSPVRDSFEIALCRRFIQTHKPVLGICRGIQLLNVALGGTLYQDLQTEFPAQTLAHRQKQRSLYPSHHVNVDEASFLANVLEASSITVNSHHHQAVRIVAPPLTAVAYSSDGVIEAIEMPQHPFCIGVQWHPERLYNNADNSVHTKLFRRFIAACMK